MKLALLAAFSALASAQLPSGQTFGLTYGGCQNLVGKDGSVAGTTCLSLADTALTVTYNVISGLAIKKTGAWIGGAYDEAPLGKANQGLKGFQYSTAVNSTKTAALSMSLSDFLPLVPAGQSICDQVFKLQAAEIAHNLTAILPKKDSLAWSSLAFSVNCQPAPSAIPAIPTAFLTCNSDVWTSYGVSTVQFNSIATSAFTGVIGWEFPAITAGHATIPSLMMANTPYVYNSTVYDWYNEGDLAGYLSVHYLNSDTMIIQISGTYAHSIISTTVYVGYSQIPTDVYSLWDCLQEDSSACTKSFSSGSYASSVTYNLDLSSQMDAGSPLYVAVYMQSFACVN